MGINPIVFFKLGRISVQLFVIFNGIFNILYGTVKFLL